MTLKASAALCTALALVFLGAVWAVGQGPGALLFIPTYAALVLPGLPLGFALFGRRHPAGWIAGAILGYLHRGFPFRPWTQALVQRCTSLCH